MLTGGFKVGAQWKYNIRRTINMQLLHALAACKLAIILRVEGDCAKHIECMDVHDIKF